MSRHYQSNFGVPPNSHPPHTGANSSNVNINRQTANTNKYEKAPPVSHHHHHQYLLIFPLKPHFHITHINLWFFFFIFTTKKKQQTNSNNQPQITLASVSSQQQQQQQVSYHSMWISVPQNEWFMLFANAKRVRNKRAHNQRFYDILNIFNNFDELFFVCVLVATAAEK